MLDQKAILDKKNLGLILLLLFLVSITAGILHTSYTRGVFHNPAPDNRALPEELSSAERKVNVEVIFDISNSMWGQVKGVNKILDSREVLSVIVKDLPSHVVLGLRTFGGDGESRLIVPLGTNNRSDIQKVINSLRPEGKSPIGYALEQAGKDLKANEGKKYIILLTDGIDNGNVDPVAKARDLRDAGVITHVVYLRNPDGTGIEELTRVAEEGGGHFFTFDEKDLVVPTMTLTH